MGVIGRILASGLLIWALANHAYGYFTFLRFIVCFVAAYNAFLAHSKHKVEWAWILGGIAVLFNPIVPLHMNRQLWIVIDVLVAAIFIISLFFVKRRSGQAGKGGTNELL